MEELNFIEAMGRFYENLRNKSQPKTFSIPVSAWTSSGKSNFPFSATISDSAVTTDDLARVDFDEESIEAAALSMIIKGNTTEGKITLLAKTVPEIELSGVYTITKGGVG